MAVGRQVVHGKLVLKHGQGIHRTLVEGDVYGSTIVFHIIMHHIHKVLDVQVAQVVIVEINQELCVSDMFLSEFFLYCSKM